MIALVMADQPTNATRDDQTPAHGWWTAFFDDLYARFGLCSSAPEEIDQAVAFLMAQLRLQPGDTVFDQCCGVGRISIPLARRGIRVLGVDLIESYINQATRAAHAAGEAVAESCEFHRGDAFTFTAPRPCDAAFNWFTSFGYSDDDAVNFQMIERAAASLKPGGRFALDYISTPKVMRGFRKRHYETFETKAGTMTILNEHTADFQRGVIDADWTFVHPDGRRETRRVMTRMFMPHEIVAMMRRAGFDEFELFGSLEGEPFKIDSIRCTVVAEKR